MGWIRLEGSAVLTDGGTCHNFYFNSTSTNPIGSGSATNPGADATMYGFFIAQGTISLTGYGCTITSQNDSSPIYITKIFDSFQNCTTFTANVCNGGANTGGGASVTIKNYVLKHFGTATTSYLGIQTDFRTAYTTPASILDIENNHIVDGYQILPTGTLALTGTGTLTISHNWIDTPRFASGTGYFEIPAAGGVPSTPVITYNVMTSPVNQGFLAYYLAGMNGTTFTHNSVYNTNTSTQAGLMSMFGASGATGGFQMNYNYADNGSQTSAGTGIADFTGDSDAADPGDTVDHNICYGGFNCVSLTSQGASGTTYTITNNWFMYQGWASVGGAQGLLITHQVSTSPGVWLLYNNEAYLESDQTGGANEILFCYSASGATNSCQAKHNTLGAFFTETQTNQLMFMGEGTTGLTNSDMHSSIVYGGKTCAICDGNNTGSTNVFSGPDSFTAFGSPVGVHHNWTYKTPAWSYSSSCSTNNDPYRDCTSVSTSKFYVSGHPHPDTGYGDIDAVDPNLFGKLNPQAYDTWRGGPGTAADIFSHQEKIWCGSNCGYDSSWENANILDYLMRSGRSFNGQSCEAGLSNTDMGAVPCYDALVNIQ